jgi:SAM-dependent methyltransferase
VWQVYDDFGETYLRHASDSAANALYDRPAVLSLVRDVGGRQVLDAGCGPGLCAEELLRRGAAVTGLDASQAQLSIARRRLGASVPLVRAVLGGNLPFRDASFDVAVCALVIHYVADRRAAFQEFARILRPGGRLVVSTQHPTTDWLRKGGSYFDIVEEEDIWKTEDGPYRVRFWREPLTALCEAATSSGLLIKSVVEPLPVDEMRDRYPDDWAQLRETPGFIALELIKPRNE